MSFFDKAKSEYIRFCDKQGVATRSICDIKIDVFTGDYSCSTRTMKSLVYLTKTSKFYLFITERENEIETKQRLHSLFTHKF